MLDRGLDWFTAPQSTHLSGLMVYLGAPASRLDTAHRTWSTNALITDHRSGRYGPDAEDRAYPKTPTGKDLIKFTGCRRGQRFNDRQRDTPIGKLTIARHFKSEKFIDNGQEAGTANDRVAQGKVPARADCQPRQLEVRARSNRRVVRFLIRVHWDIEIEFTCRQ